MEDKDNNWKQSANADDSKVREGKSSLDQLNQSNEQRESGNWKDAEKKGNGDYGAEGGRSDAGVTGGETAISRPFGGNPEGRAASEGKDEDEWNAQHPGELPV